MSVSLVDVAGANFRTDEESDKLNTVFMSRLGMRKRYLPARLAIARSLAMPSVPPLLDPESEYGKAIKGDTLFGTGTALLSWLALIVQRTGEPHLDTRRVLAIVAAHWRRGLGQLDGEWNQAGGDLTKFVSRLVDVAGLPRVGGRWPGERASAPPPVSTGRLSVAVGEIAQDVQTGERIVWDLNGPGGSPHCAIMGGVGSGKTRTAVAMLRSLREQAQVPLIAFDFKGDLGADASGSGYRVDELFEAKSVEPPREPVPLNVLSLPSREKIDIAEAAQRFRESFSRLKGSRLGDRQRDALYEAAERALERNEPCSLANIRDELIRIYEEREMREDGALATFRDLCRFPLFRSELSPEEFFRRSWIIKLPSNVSEDSKTIVVNLVLDALDRYLNRLPDAPISADNTRGLRVVCVIDEAHKILGTKLPSLSNLIRMSRSKGGAIMLISQSPDDFSGEDDDFLSEMGLVAAFNTNAPPRNAGRVLGRGAILTSLQTGQCYAKRRDDQSAKKIQAWQR